MATGFLLNSLRFLLPFFSLLSCFYLFCHVSVYSVMCLITQEWLCASMFSHVQSSLNKGLWQSVCVCVFWCAQFARVCKRRCALLTETEKWIETESHGRRKGITFTTPSLYHGYMIKPYQPATISNAPLFHHLFSSF